MQSILNYFKFLLNLCLYHFIVIIIIIGILIPCFYCCDYYFNDYLTSFYVNHFELPLCMKCAI